MERHCGEQQKSNVKDQIDPCPNGRDTMYALQFSIDSSSTDFYKLLDFIESKSQFARINQEHKIDSSSTDSIVLKKILCYAKYYDSPMEKCILKVLTIRTVISLQNIRWKDTKTIMRVLESYK